MNTPHGLCDYRIEMCKDCWITYKKLFWVQIFLKDYCGIQSDICPRGVSFAISSCSQ